MPFPVALVACGEGLGSNDQCLVDLAPISARTNVVNVGDTLTLEADLGPAECLPAGITMEAWRWSSLDSLIARVDSLTGVVEGVSPGDVLIEVRHAQNPIVASGIGLQVVGTATRESSGRTGRP
jgi:Bacterial Ig-like domain (group 2)